MTHAVNHDPHYPELHLRPPENWVNDPNGLVFHDGHYHVFFQYNPYGTEHADMHWGHMRSTDLLNWQLLPVALAPTPDGRDSGGIWSGNAVDLGDRLVAFYSARHPDLWHQPVAQAVSSDGGVTFTKQQGPDMPPPPPEATMYRDPYVWRTDDGGWRMLVGAALKGERAAALQYASADLETWTYQGLFLSRAPEPLPSRGDTARGWECPQYAHFGDGRGALLVGAWDPETGPRHTAVFTGRLGPDGFAAGAPQRLDCGPDFYAPGLLRAPDGRWLLWGWCWDSPTAETRADRWAGMLSLPREIGLDAAGNLWQRPARELTRLRDEHVVRQSGTVTSDNPVRLGPVGPCFEVAATLGRTEGATAGIRLLTASAPDEFLDIRLDRETGDLVVDRRHASRTANEKDTRHRIAIAGAQQVALRAIVDHSVCEVFLTTGQALTLRFYPSHGEDWSLLCVADGTGTAPFTVDAWNLSSPPAGTRGPLGAKG